jgi:hypothetical protein
MLQACVQVFRHRRYAAVAFLVTFALYSFLALLPNAAVLWQVLTLAHVSLFDRVSFVASLYYSLFSNTSTVAAVLTVGALVLVGVNSALLVYYVRRRRTKRSGRTAGVLGVSGLISSVLGVGCAACGSVILVAVTGLTGASGLMAVLPYHGTEFAFLGVLFLGVTFWYLTRHINDPVVCQTEPLGAASVQRL